MCPADATRWITESTARPNADTVVAARVVADSIAEPRKHHARTWLVSVTSVDADNRVRIPITVRRAGCRAGIGQIDPRRGHMVEPVCLGSALGVTRLIDNRSVAAAVASEPQVTQARVTL